MNNKLALALILLISLGITLGILFTSNFNYFGALIGLGAGFANIQWLSRDTKKAIDQDKLVALKIYFKSLFSRLGFITLIVVMVGRFKPDWLIYLVVGIAVGILIPLLISIRHQIVNGRG